MEIKVTQVSETLKNSFNENHRKVNKFLKEYKVFVNENGSLDYKITFRLYGTQRHIYGVLWVVTDEDEFVASSKANWFVEHWYFRVLVDCLEKMGFEVSNVLVRDIEDLLQKTLDCVYGENYFDGILVSTAQG